MTTSIEHILQKNKTDFKSISDLQPLIDSIKNKKVVMLGEASHGTHEYYTWRARISKILIEEHGFNFIAVEGDWPPCYELNRYVKNYNGSKDNALAALQEFKRWPSWMWANWEIFEFAEWLKKFNERRDESLRSGFYGLDVYSLWESLDAVIVYLEENQPSALDAARKAMRCFEPYRDEDGKNYAFSTRLVPKGCSEEVGDMLLKIRRDNVGNPSDNEHSFSTEQNAIVAKNAEAYYREMAAGSSNTWNLRDSHMMDTLERLLQFHGPNAKAIVWAHNTHIGDAQFTDMANQGLYNIGELARQHYGQNELALVGFGSYSGKVMAGSSWGANAQIMELPKAPKNSWEYMCHKAGEQFHLNMEHLENNILLQEPVLHRAVGVVYNPEYESYGNYVPSLITKRYDHFLFFDYTKALHKIDIEVKSSKVPETYPFGL